MKNKTIFLRTVLNKAKIRKHISRFYRYVSNISNSRYITLQTKIAYVENGSDKNKNIGSRFILDLESLDEIKYYSEYVITNINDILETNPEVLKSIAFEYAESDKEIYDKFISDIIHKKTFNERNFKHLNLNLNDLF